VVVSSEEQYQYREWRSHGTSNPSLQTYPHAPKVGSCIELAAYQLPSAKTSQSRSTARYRMSIVMNKRMSLQMYHHHNPCPYSSPNPVVRVYSLCKEPVALGRECPTCSSVLLDSSISAFEQRRLNDVPSRGHIHGHVVQRNSSFTRLSQNRSIFRPSMLDPVSTHACFSWTALAVHLCRNDRLLASAEPYHYCVANFSSRWPL
jgi:hypothetical protein